MEHGGELTSMFVVHSGDLDPVEDIGFFSWSLLAVIHETVPNLKWALIKSLCRGFNLPSFGPVWMES